MDQIDEQVWTTKLIHKEVESEFFKNSVLNKFYTKHFKAEKMYSEIIGQRTRRRLEERERKLFKINFEFDIEEAVFCDRLKFEGKLYHSYNYSRKGKLNSYTVSYLENEKSEFGRLEYFFEVKGKFYAYIKKINISDDLSTTIPKSSGKFYDFVLKQLKNYYKLIQKSQFIIYDIIDCKSIQKKCIIIESEKNEFITEMSYEFEHD